MAHFQTAIFLGFLITVGLAAYADKQNRNSPTLGAPVVIESDGIGECPSDEDRQDALDLIFSRSEQVLQNYSNNSNCGPGLWRRVFYLNTSSQDQSCPGDWNVRTASSVRGCAGAGRSCRSAYSDEISLECSRVCGRVIGIGQSTLDAFHRFISGQTTIEDNYLDGVSVTHGAPGSRAHFWSFGAGHSPPRRVPYLCPCDYTGAALPPLEVGENYFCSRSASGHLWTGTDCTSDNPCCSFHNPSYFSVQLPSPTTDRIELRICADQDMRDEYILVLFTEIYVQ